MDERNMFIQYDPDTKELKLVPGSINAYCIFQVPQASEVSNENFALYNFNNSKTVNDLIRIANNGMSGTKLLYVPPLGDQDDIYKDKRSLFSLDLKENQKDFSSGYDVTIKAPAIS